jgi:hypothetical protein
MATGYTYCIKNGIKFEDFVMKCARAFGACVTLRDDMDAPIPDKFEPSLYHLKAVEDSKQRLKELMGMTLREAEIHAEEYYDKAVKTREERLKECKRLEKKYKAMLEKVRAWKAPTADHEELKAFMIMQITESIQSDCNTKWILADQPEKISGVVWKQNRIKDARASIAYHRAEHMHEIERCDSRTKWIKDLRKSLKKARKEKGK